MHRKAMLAVLGLGVVVGAGAWYWPWDRRPEQLKLFGTVEVQEVRLGSKVGGRVATIHVRESQIVEPGTVLVSFETPELTARRDASQSRLWQAKAALDKARNGPRDEEIVAARFTADAAMARYDRIKSGFRTEQKSQAAHDLESALAEEKQAEADYTRVKSQWDTGAGSFTDLTAAIMVRDRARGRVKSSRDTVDMMRNGSRPQEIEEARAEWERSEAQYQLLRRGTRPEDKAAAAATVAEAQALLDEAEANLREATVTAPERCLIQTMAVRPGDLVPTGRPVVTVHRTNDMWVKVFVPATELGKLKLGQAVEVTVDSHPGKRFAGEVIHIDPVSEFTPRNVQSVDERKHQVFAVKVRITDPEGVFKSGMAAEVFIPLNP